MRTYRAAAAAAAPTGAVAANTTNSTKTTVSIFSSAGMHWRNGPNRSGPARLPSGALNKPNRPPFTHRSDAVRTFVLQLYRAMSRIQLESHRSMPLAMRGARGGRPIRGSFRAPGAPEALQEALGPLATN